MAMRFYTGSRFPARYRNGAFVAMRGSWNRGEPAGYKVVFVRFSEAGEPLGFEDFLDGFVDRTADVYHGRPVGIAFASDGALLVSDDSNGAIYRVTYRGAADFAR